MSASASGFGDPQSLREIARSVVATRLWCDTAQTALYDAADELKRLRKIEEAARAYLAVPRTVAKDPDGVIRMDFTPQLEARKTLATALAGVETPTEGTPDGR